MWPRARLTRVLILAAVLLAAAGVLHAATTATPALIGFVLALAMGAENTLLDTGGLLVETAWGLTDRLLGTAPHHRWIRSLRLWGAVVVGAAVGAYAYRMFAFNALWIAVGAAPVAATVVRNIPTGPAEPVGPYGLES
ncbi:hypothetical protein [Rhodococcus koreensis]|jgi:uncharacterized membrane protein YoaK (UPF0700 family)|uniref:hypothetical protein n=1 Tax=Rhodococcus koreensis TaxID=99653 RepID=UPI001F128147|nr:hypothetical protein [Rhodococcus koreensis]